MRRFITLLSTLCLSGIANAEGTLTGDDIIAKVNAREEANFATRKFSIELTDRSGHKRSEETIAYRRYFGDEKRTIIFYTEPNRVRGTGFLTFDYAKPTVDDDQWLYLPALRKVRRISASDRGDFFLGTDFTYEEIKKEQKVEASDYRFKADGFTTLDDRELLLVKGTPASPDIADELSTSLVVWHIDADIWMSRKTQYYDQNGNLARTARLVGVERIDGYLTATEIFVENHKTGHSSRISFSDIDFTSRVPENLFSQTRLRRGL